jgi:hypothetical protein
MPKNISMNTNLARFASGSPVDSPFGPAAVIDDRGRGFLPLIMTRADCQARYVNREQLRALTVSDDTCIHCGMERGPGHDLEGFHQAARLLGERRYQRRLTM